MNQYEKDIATFGMWTKTQATLMANGAAYARREVARRLRELRAENGGYCDTDMDVFIAELEGE